MRSRIARIARADSTVAFRVTAPNVDIAVSVVGVVACRPRAKRVKNPIGVVIVVIVDVRRPSVVHTRASV
jgi:hypothetical protein